MKHNKLLMIVFLMGLGFNAAFADRIEESYVLRFKEQYNLKKKVIYFEFCHTEGDKDEECSTIGKNHSKGFSLSEIIYILAYAKKIAEEMEDKIRSGRFAPNTNRQKAYLVHSKTAFELSLQINSLDSLTKALSEGESMLEIKIPDGLHATSKISLDFLSDALSYIYLE